MPQVKDHEQTDAKCVHVGCQGWNYDDWVSGPANGGRIFYPHGTRAAEMLEVYARAFETVEVDSTFYAIPSAATVDGWVKRTPPGFTFSLKLPQEITHERSLREGSARVLAEFGERAKRLGPKLAVILIQLPPQFTATAENFAALSEFLPQLPRDLRFSIEFRDSGWIEERVMNLLAQYTIAPTLVEGQWIEPAKMRKMADQLIADFTYVRWMGARNLVRFDSVQRPQDKNLQAWSETITQLQKRVSHVYAYFSNYYEGHAPAGANKLKRLLGQPAVEAAALEDQPSLF